MGCNRFYFVTNVTTAAVNGQTPLSLACANAGADLGIKEG